MFAGVVEWEEDTLWLSWGSSRVGRADHVGDGVFTEIRFVKETVDPRRSDWYSLVWSFVEFLL